MLLLMSAAADMDAAFVQAAAQAVLCLQVWQLYRPDMRTAAACAVTYCCSWREGATGASRRLVLVLLLLL